MWNRTSPGVDGASCPFSPRIALNGRRSIGRGPSGRSRSHSARPIPTTHDSLDSDDRKPTVLTKSAMPDTTSRAVASDSSSSRTDSTRKIAWRVSGWSTACPEATVSLIAPYSTTRQRRRTSQTPIAATTNMNNHCSAPTSITASASTSALAAFDDASHAACSSTANM